MEKEILIGVAALGSGVIGKIVWDWLKIGRAEGGVYVKTTDCASIRKECCVGGIKIRMNSLENEMTEHGVRLHETEKQLDRGREDFKAIRSDISEIKTILARMTAIFENGFKRIGE